VSRPPLIVLAGPTASGKTSLSIALAHRLDAEIVAMDSMQVYRHMDIGTAKPGAQEQEGIPHHMLDVADPREAYSVAEYVSAAKACIADIHARGRIPLMVGGTGLYLKALTTSMVLGNTQGDPELRARLETIAQAENGQQILHEKLSQIDPDTARRLHPNDVRRVIRALEVYELTGKPLSRQQPAQEEESPYNLCVFGLTMDREKLYGRIEERVDLMMKQGLQREVEGLLQMGVSPQAQAMQGLGYKELVPVVMGESPLSAAVDAIKLGTRHYAKRQMTWFRATKDIIWLDALANDCFEQAHAHISAFFRGQKESNRL
jgi:tRNA dimethylallyltransferase